MHSVIRASVALFAVAAVVSCTTASVRVMPGDDGTNRVVVRDVEKYAAEEAAVDAANDYCRERGKDAVFLGDSVEYTGTMDEEEREAIRRQAEAATIMGGVIRATEARDAAVIFEGAGAVGRSTTSGKDYMAEVRFTCE